MKATVSLLAAAILLFWGHQTVAKDMIVSRDGDVPQEALRHVDVKTVVAEFGNPTPRGMGRSLGALIYAEAWNAMSDQRGAGLLYLITEMDESVGMIDKLDQVDGSENYHVLVEKIATRQRARVALWGIVSEEGDDLVIRSYLTVLERETDRDLSLRLTADGRARRIEGRLLPGDGIELSLLPNRINFEPVVINRKELFSQQLVTSRSVELRDAPSPTESSVIETLPPGTRLRAIDMQGLYFAVRHNDGATVYVDHDQVTVEPRRFEGRPEKRYSLAAVHFLAGLYRYYGGRYDEAVAQFRLFVEVSGEDGYPYNRALAQQMIGASYLMMGDSARALSALQEAQALSPYDPAVYRLAAVAGLESGPDARDAVGFVAEALRLDRQDGQTLMLLKSFDELSRMDAGHGVLSTRLSPVRESIVELERKFPAPDSESLLRNLQNEELRREP